GLDPGVRASGRNHPHLYPLPPKEGEEVNFNSEDPGDIDAGRRNESCPTLDRELNARKTSDFSAASENLSAIFIAPAWCTQQFCAAPTPTPASSGSMRQRL